MTSPVSICYEAGSKFEGVHQLTELTICMAVHGSLSRSPILLLGQDTEPNHQIIIRSYESCLKCKCMYLIYKANMW